MKSSAHLYRSVSHSHLDHAAIKFIETVFFASFDENALEQSHQTRTLVRCRRIKPGVWCVYAQDWMLDVVWMNPIMVATASFEGDLSIFHEDCRAVQASTPHSFIQRSILNAAFTLDMSSPM
jgi:hypothetical protein